MENEERLIVIANEIVGMRNTVLGIIGKILELKEKTNNSGKTDFELLKSWYEQKVGRELNVAKDALDIRRLLVEFLKSKNIDVPDDNELEMEQFDFIFSNDDYLTNWDNDSTYGNINSRKR